MTSIFRVKYGFCSHFSGISYLCGRDRRTATLASGDAAPRILRETQEPRRLLSVNKNHTLCVFTPRRVFKKQSAMWQPRGAGRVVPDCRAWVPLWFQVLPPLHGSSAPYVDALASYHCPTESAPSVQSSPLASFPQTSSRAAIERKYT